MTFDIYKYRPFITLKISASLDGKFATKDRSGQEILKEEARARVQEELSKRDAILTGIGTILKDDPSLLPQGDGLTYDGIRVVLDTHLQIPLDAQIISMKWMGDIWIFTSPDADKDKKSKLEAMGIPVSYQALGNRVSFAASIMIGLGVIEYEPRSTAADEIRELIKEIEKQKSIAKAA